MKTLSSIRKTSKADGDDTTLTRYVKIEAEHRVRRRQPRLPGFESAFILEGRTKFPTRVIRVGDMPKLLVSGHSNVKIGRDVRKGHLKGYWIYTLSLEERKTCPSSCKHWQTCYGNNMPLAKRIQHNDPDFLPRLEEELAQLISKFNGRILVRLHALGDFYSVEYVQFWRRMLKTYPSFHIFGYTARDRRCHRGSASRIRSALHDPLLERRLRLNVHRFDWRCGKPAGKRLYLPRANR